MKTKKKLLFAAVILTSGFVSTSVVADPTYVDCGNTYCYRAAQTVCTSTKVSCCPPANQCNRLKCLTLADCPTSTTTVAMPVPPNCAIAFGNLCKGWTCVNPPAAVNCK